MRNRLKKFGNGRVRASLLVDVPIPGKKAPPAWYALLILLLTAVAAVLFRWVQRYLDL